MTVTELIDILRDYRGDMDVAFINPEYGFPSPIHEVGVYAVTGEGNQMAFYSDRFVGSPRDVVVLE